MCAILHQSVPKTFHRIWLGGAPIPADSRRYWCEWSRLHPTWEMRTWTERDLWPLRNQSEFDQAATPAQRADILRLEVLSRYGGIYVDTDFEPLRALDGLVTSDCFFAREDNRWVAIGIIGSRPGHPFIDHLIERLPDSVRSRSGISEQTGPKFVTRELWTWRAKPADTPTVYPPELFYPYHFSQPNRRAGPFPGAYAVHHWAGSWTTS